MEFRSGRGACYASNIALAHIIVLHLFRPWATKREGKGIDENGLRAILGLGLPSKGLGIKDKSCWLGLHSPCTFPCMQAIEKALLPPLLCLESCFHLSICFPLLLCLRSIPLYPAHASLLLILFPIPSRSRSSKMEDPRTMFVTPSQLHHLPALTRKCRGGELSERLLQDPHDTWVSI